MLRLRCERNEDYRLRLSRDSWRDEGGRHLHSQFVLRGKTGRDQVTRGCQQKCLQ
jgi:hypothetical protein